MHEIAADVAKEATKQFIRDIKAAVTPSQLKLLLGDGSGTLTFVIDTTANGAGSRAANSTGTTEGMGSIIDAVKEQAIQIVNARVGTDEEPSKYVLVPFNDPGIGPVTETTDANVFKNALAALSATAGTTVPELSQAGMHEALAASDEGGELFMFIRTQTRKTQRWPGLLIAWRSTRISRSTPCYSAPADHPSTDPISEKLTISAGNSSPFEQRRGSITNWPISSCAPMRSIFC